MATNQTDEDLSRLERDIRQLKIEYEQYFGGGKKRPPADIEWRIEPLPDLPTVAESGYAGYGLDFWMGVVAPAKTPPAKAAPMPKAATPPGSAGRVC